MSISTYRAKPDLAANLDVCNIQVCTAAREYTLCFLARHIEADVFRRDKWRLRESGTVILLEL
jgi:hypothetical protein